MKFINEEILQQILSHYPTSDQKLVKSQILKMESLIEEHKDEYFKNKDFQKAFDIVLRKIVEGNFLLREEN